ncbi:MAG TPA: Ig-like domain-containing protein, partial [Longimicrobiaceae bacterium]|nr:Ig-like domain-containing protein [Longimicrobiaceae bacterium]
TWTLGAAAGANAATATVTGAGPVSFAATATPAGAAAISKAGGDGQTAPAGSVLPAPLTVKVTDAGGNAVPGAAVSWSVGSGGGSLSPASSVTDASGQASATWTLGAAAGANTATASVGGLAAVTFGATATSGPPDPNVARVQVWLPAATMGIGVTVQARALPLDANGKHIPDLAITWSSSNASVARISESGLITGVSEGTATITATAGGKSGTESVTVSRSAPDVSPPEVTGFSISPMEVDVVSSPQAVTFTVGFKDETGVSSTSPPWVVAAPPSGNSQGCILSLAAGTPQNGTWTCTWRIPAGSEPGTYTIQAITMADSRDNRSGLGPAQLQARGWPSTFQVKNAAPDVEAPVLTGFSVTPGSVSVASGSASIEFTFAAHDAVAGGVVASIDFTSPAGEVLSCPGWQRVSGDANAGVWKCIIAIPQGAPAGTWTVSRLVVRDILWNRRTYTAADLKAAGFPTEVTVTR